MPDYKGTSYSDGFGIFNKISEEEFDVPNKNYLRLFMLNTENKLFTYDELYEYILPNVSRYVFSRKYLAEAENNPRKRETMILDAISHLRPILDNKDKGAGGELGEILLYLFLEQDLKAPKLFSKVELKTSASDYVKGADGIHYRFRASDAGKKIMQIVIGEAKIQNELREGIDAAFASINDYITNNTQDRSLLDRHLLEQIVDEEEAAEIKEYIVSIPRKPRETVFGIFIGYSVKYDGSNDTNDEYAKKIIAANVQQVLAYKERIIEKIREYKVSNYEFNFYFLPFHDAARDRKTIMKSLTQKEPHLVWGDIKNG